MECHKTAWMSQKGTKAMPTVRHEIPLVAEFLAVDIPLCVYDE